MTVPAASASHHVVQLSSSIGKAEVIGEDEACDGNR